MNKLAAILSPALAQVFGKEQTAAVPLAVQGTSDDPNVPDPQTDPQAQQDAAAAQGPMTDPNSLPGSINAAAAIGVSGVTVRLSWPTGPSKPRPRGRVAVVALLRKARTSMPSWKSRMGGVAWRRDHGATVVLVANRAQAARRNSGYQSNRWPVWGPAPTQIFGNEQTATIPGWAGGTSRARGSVGLSGQGGGWVLLEEPWQRGHGGDHQGQSVRHGQSARCGQVSLW